MLDCENRISAARYFLERARDGVLPDSLHVWYTQATIIFGVAALENLMYDYAERKTGRPVKRTERADLRYFKRMLGSQTDFYNRLEIGMNKSKLYWFLRNERNEIAHRGERNKSSAGEVDGQLPITLRGGHNSRSMRRARNSVTGPQA